MKEMSNELHAQYLAPVCDPWATSGDISCASLPTAWIDMGRFGWVDARHLTEAAARGCVVLNARRSLLEPAK
ncbi:hypothetical protein FACS189449_08920 [Alphaproteobacteria bacterium]|nr:hypothetical protein FACS189449_08920 [Alphaproteobacteria bacterium]